MDIRAVVSAARRIEAAREIPAIACSATAAEALAKYEWFLFDCDGNVLSELRRLGKKVLFITNNSSKSRATYAKRFARLGIEVAEAELFPSSYCAARYVQRHLPHVRKAFVIGDTGLSEELELAGVKTVSYTGGKDGLEPLDSEAAFSAARVDPDIGAVVCGWDLRFDYSRMAFASLCVQHNPGCRLVATNLDPHDRFPDRMIPGNGCAIAALEAACNMKALLAGKPSSVLADLLSELPGFEPSRACMIGDRLDTDIAFGKVAGVDTMLTLTGTTTEAIALELDQDHEHRPDYVLPYIGALVGDTAGAEPPSKQDTL